MANYPDSGRKKRKEKDFFLEGTKKCRKKSLQSNLSRKKATREAEESSARK